MKRYSRLMTVAVGLLAIATSAQAYKEVPPPANVVLPPPKSPAESLAAIVVPPGFEVELVAGKPWAFWRAVRQVEPPLIR